MTMTAASVPLDLCYYDDGALPFQPPTKKRQSGLQFHGTGSVLNYSDNLDDSVDSEAVHCYSDYFTANEEESEAAKKKFLVPADTWRLVMRFLLGFHTGDDDNYLQRKTLHDELLSPVGFTFEAVRPTNMLTDLPRRCIRVDQCMHCLRSSSWVFSEFYNQESEYVDYENDSFYVTCGETRWMELESGHQCYGLIDTSMNF